jgi:hypothetical protein
MPDPVTDPAKVENPPVTDPPKLDPPTDPPKDPSDPLNWDPERAKATIEAQRASEKEKDAEIKRLKKIETDLQAIKDAEKTELEREREAREKLENENPKLIQELQDARLQVALADPTLGIADPEIAATLLKQRGLTFSKNGSPENLTEAVTALLEAKPLLKKGEAEPPKPNVPNIDAGAGQGNGPAPNLNAEELDAAKELGQDPILFAELKRARQANGGMMTYEQYKAAVERANAAGGT